MTLANTALLHSPTINLQPLLRGAMFVSIASFVTFLLFVLMQYLIKPTELPPIETTPYQVIDPVFAKQDSPVITNSVLPSKPNTAPPPSLKPQVEDPGDDTPIATFSNGPNIPTTSIASNLPTFTVTDAEAKPMVRVEPKYPMEAARNGIEGWVQLRFDINPAGRVENVEVVEAEPSRVFNQEAKRALLRWKYQPKIVDGVAQSQQNQNVMLSFKLGE